MEFMNRGNRPTQPSGSQASPVSASNGSSNRKSAQASQSLKLVTVALLFSATILLVALLSYVVFRTPRSESRFVTEDRMQAVFLNGGQVYFGHIRSLNSDYLRLGDIYYLRVNQQVQPDQSTQTSANDISLVKLGCELHGPQDEMLINRDQVVFWENLKNDGQVAKAVDEYKKQNPNGQQCNTQTQQSNTNGATDNTGNAANKDQ